MKLQKQYAGCYTATAMVDGYKIEVKANAAEEYNGFRYDVRVNGTLVQSDGFGGLRLKDIKQIIQWPEKFIDYLKQG